MLRRTTILLTALLSGACTPVITPETNYNRATDFSALTTYAWNDSDVVMAGTYDPEVRARVDSIIRSTVNEEMAKKGITQSTLGEADLQVSYSIVVSDQEQSAGPQTDRPVMIVDSSTNIGDAAKVIRPGTAEGQLGQTRTYRHGTLILFMMNKQGQIIWQGTVEGTAITPREALGKSSKAIKALMAEFPPNS